MTPGGIAVCLDWAAGEYAKGCFHNVEMTGGLETDTSEIVNEMITSTRVWGLCGLIGVYGRIYQPPQYRFSYARRCGPDQQWSSITSQVSVLYLPVQTMDAHVTRESPAWHELLEMIVKGDLDPTVLVTHRLGLSDADQVYPLFDKRGENDAIRLETRFSAPVAPGTPKLVRF